MSSREKDLKWLVKWISDIRRGRHERREDAVEILLIVAQFAAGLGENVDHVLQTTLVLNKLERRSRLDTILSASMDLKAGPVVVEELVKTMLGGLFSDWSGKLPDMQELALVKARELGCELVRKGYDPRAVLGLLHGWATELEWFGREIEDSRRQAAQAAYDEILGLWIEPTKGRR